MIGTAGSAVAVLALGRRGLSGAVPHPLGGPGLDVSTTVAACGRHPYLPNARFGVEVTPETTCTAVRSTRWSLERRRGFDPPSGAR
jgi:hypothetical protein